MTAGLGLPAAALASTTRTQLKETRLSQISSSGLSYRVLGKTGLKVTSVGFGCMITSDPTRDRKGG